MYIAVVLIVFPISFIIYSISLKFLTKKWIGFRDRLNNLNLRRIIAILTLIIGYIGFFQLFFTIFNIDDDVFTSISVFSLFAFMLLILPYTDFVLKESKYNENEIEKVVTESVVNAGRGREYLKEKSYVMEVVIGVLVLIIISLISILFTTAFEVEGLGINLRTILEILTLIVISLTAFFTLKSARAARDSAAASSASIESMQLGEKRRIKPFIAVLSKEVKLERSILNEDWDDEGNCLELVILNSNLATDVSIGIEVKNITQSFITDLKKIGVVVDLNRKSEGLSGKGILIKSSEVVSLAETSSNSFESVLSKEIKNGRIITIIPEAFILLLNAHAKIASKFSGVPYLEAKIQYSDFEGNDYHDTWNFYCERISKGGGTTTVSFKSIKK